MEYSEIMSDPLSPLEHYEATTKNARETFIPQTRSNHIATTIDFPEFIYDTERMIEEEIPSDISPLWLRALLWAVGMSVATFLLVLVAVLAGGIAKLLLYRK